MYAEVAMITRNIKIHGEMEDFCYDETRQRYNFQKKKMCVLSMSMLKLFYAFVHIDARKLANLTTLVATLRLLRDLPPTVSMVLSFSTWDNPLFLEGKYVIFVCAIKNV